MQPQIQALPELERLKKKAASLVKERYLIAPKDEASKKRYSDLEIEAREIDGEISKLKEDIIANSRKIVTLPKAYRGSVPVVGNIEPQIREAVQGGRSIVSNYVRKKLLRPTGFISLPMSHPRAIHSKGWVLLNPSHDASMAAHEIVHWIEKRPSVLKEVTSHSTTRKGRLAKKSVPLNQLHPEGNYQPDEKAFEDEWKARGGSTAYPGKDYSKDGNPLHAPTTELLTEGIERLHSNPALFAATDPEYFTFVVNTLRKL